MTRLKIALLLAFSLLATSVAVGADQYIDADEAKNLKELVRKIPNIEGQYRITFPKDSAVEKSIKERCEFCQARTICGRDSDGNVVCEVIVECFPMC